MAGTSRIDQQGRILLLRQLSNASLEYGLRARSVIRPAPDGAQHLQPRRESPVLLTLALLTPLLFHASADQPPHKPAAKTPAPLRSCPLQHQLPIKRFPNRRRRANSKQP